MNSALAEVIEWQIAIDLDCDPPLNYDLYANKSNK